MDTEPEILIVGAGLAGSTLAWSLQFRHRPFRIVDAGDPRSSSRVAAGFINPITGQRFALSWRFAELYARARAFYRRVESHVGKRLLIPRPMVRLFQNELEKERYLRKARHPDGLNGIRIGEIAPPLAETDFRSGIGGFELPEQTQLNVAEYLDATRRRFADRVHTGILDPATLRLHRDSVEVPALARTFRCVVFCQGIAAMDNPFFADLPFAPAKGEILTLRIPGLRENRIVNRGVWLVPHGDDLFRAGATYDRDHIDTVPTLAGRAEIESRLREFLRLPFEVVDHVAGIRPILDDRKPLLGRHPRFDSLALFNGLGSKGSLQAPYFAEQLADGLCGTGTIDADVDRAG